MFELLDDLRDQIGAQYSVQLFEFSRQQHLHAQPIEPTAKSTFNRPEPHRSVAAFCMVLHRRQQGRMGARHADWLLGAERAEVLGGLAYQPEVLTARRACCRFSRTAPTPSNSNG